MPPPLPACFTASRPDLPPPFAPGMQHLYAPPTRRVFLYEPEEDRVVQRVPGFYSRGGHVVKEG